MSFVAIKSVDAAWVRLRAEQYAKELLSEHSEIEEVIFFGSFANDTYAPGSDLDVFIVLSQATEPIRDRISTFLPRGSFPVPVDVFPFTRPEIAERQSSAVIAAANKSGWRYVRQGERAAAPAEE